VPRAGRPAQRQCTRRQEHQDRAGRDQNERGATGERDQAGSDATERHPSPGRVGDAADPCERDQSHECRRQALGTRRQRRLSERGTGGDERGGCHAGDEASTCPLDRSGSDCRRQRQQQGAQKPNAPGSGTRRIVEPLGLRARQIDSAEAPGRRQEKGIPGLAVGIGPGRGLRDRRRRVHAAPRLVGRRPQIVGLVPDRHDAGRREKKRERGAETDDGDSDSEVHRSGGMGPQGTQPSPERRASAHRNGDARSIPRRTGSACGLSSAG
jgi:hypothetical protein